MTFPLFDRTRALRQYLSLLAKQNRRAPHPVVRPLPAAGFDENRSSVPLIERLDDETLKELNSLLPWKSFTVDSLGRRFGDRRSPWKNTDPRPVPDPRVVLAAERFALNDKSVLEVGCFEGGHTIALCRAAKEVVALDGRVVNAVKTMVRCSFYETHPKVMVCDVESWDPEDFQVDVVFHVGVLYHLRDPVRHIFEPGRIAKEGLLLDTHVAGGDEITDTFVSNGVSYRYRRYDEMPWLPAAGLHNHGKWLLLDDLIDILHAAGFNSVDVTNSRKEGPSTRVTIIGGKHNSADVAPLEEPRRVATD